MADFLGESSPAGSAQFRQGAAALRSMKAVLNRAFSTMFSALSGSSSSFRLKWVTGDLVANDASNDALRAVGAAHWTPGAVTADKLAAGLLTADTAGRAKMVNGFLTFPKLDAALVASAPAKASVVAADKLVVADSEASGALKLAAVSGLSKFGNTASGYVCWSYSGSTLSLVKKSANVATVTRTATGRYTVALATAYPSAVYCVLVQIRSTESYRPVAVVSSQTASSFVVKTRQVVSASAEIYFDPAGVDVLLI